MPVWLQAIFYVVAFLCFLLVAFSVRTRWSNRINLVGLGLALWVFVPLVGALRRLGG
jgi:hypothetical protein